MPHQSIRPAGLYPDAQYEYAVVAPAGPLVFTAGACPLDPDGRVVAPGDFEAQARQALANLLDALAAVGCDAHHVLKTTIYVASDDRADLVRVWNVIAPGLSAQSPPSTLLGVTALGYPDQLVEIEAIALGRSEAEAAGAGAGAGAPA